MLGFCHGKPPANSKLKYDGWKNNHLPSEMMTWRGLKDALNGKGSVDVFVGQMEFKDLLFNKQVPKLISNLIMDNKIYVVNEMVLKTFSGTVSPK